MNAAHALGVIVLTLVGISIAHDLQTSLANRRRAARLAAARADLEESFEAAIAVAMGTPTPAQLAIRDRMRADLVDWLAEQEGPRLAEQVQSYVNHPANRNRKSS